MDELGQDRVELVRYKEKCEKLEKKLSMMESVATAQEFADWLTNEGIVLDYGSNVGRESVGDAFIRFLAETASLAEVPE